MTTATKTYTLGRFVWRELFSNDVAASKRFYGELLGWTFKDMPMGHGTYTLCHVGEKQVAGMMDIKSLPEGMCPPPHWAVYVSVADVDAAAKVATEQGGKVMVPCNDIPGVGRFAVIQDPQGAMFNLFRNVDGDPADEMAGVGDFTWENLASTDPKAALGFYQQVVGWGVEQMGDGPVMLFTRKGPDGSPLPLVSVGQADGGHSHWSTFIRVEDVDASLAKIEALGGKVYMGKTPIPETGEFAFVGDNEGTLFAIYKPLGYGPAK